MKGIGVFMYSLVKIVGPVDFSGLRLTDELMDDYVIRGHLTLNDHGDDYNLSDIIGGPIRFERNSGSILLYSKIYNGPDRTIRKVQTVVDNIGRKKLFYRYGATLGFTADGTKNKLRIFLEISANGEGSVRLV